MEAVWCRLEGLQHLGPLEDPQRVAACILRHADKALYKAYSRQSAGATQQHSFSATQAHAQSKL